MDSIYVYIMAGMGKVIENASSWFSTPQLSMKFVNPGPGTIGLGVPVHAYHLSSTWHLVQAL